MIQLAKAAREQASYSTYVFAFYKSLIDDDVLVRASLSTQDIVYRYI